MQTSGTIWQDESLYLCLEIDQFPAQAFAAFHPQFQDNPFVIVQQEAESHKSLVFACSPAARRLGARPGLPLHEMNRNFKGVEAVPRDKSLEEMAVRELGRIIEDYTPECESKGLGSFVLDLSQTPGKSLLPAEEIGSQLRAEIQARVCLPEIALGISRSKLLARMLARMARPNDVKICCPGEEAGLLHFMDFRFLPGLSLICREKLRKYGLKKVGQIQHLDRDSLRRRFGDEGDKLFGLFQDLDIKPPTKKSPEIAAETVFKKDINNQQIIDRYLHHAADQLAYQLQTRGLLTQQLTCVLKYTDYRTVQRSGRLPTASCDCSPIAILAGQLFGDLYQRRVAIKSIKILAKNPQAVPEQLGLFDTRKEKKGRHFRAGITQVRNRFSFASLCCAGELGVTVPAKPAASLEPTVVEPQIDPQWQPPPAPPDISTKNFLVGLPLPQSPDLWPQYQKSFPIAEIHICWNRDPLRADFARIEQKSKTGMLYAVMVNKKISQPKVKDVQAAIDLLKVHMAAVGPLVESGRFYSFLFQLAEAEIRNQPMLHYLLQVVSVAVRARLDVHVEFSHPSWHIPFILRALKDHGIGLCNSGDSALATTDKGYIRYRDAAPAGPNQSMLQKQIELSKKVSSLAIIHHLSPLTAAWQAAVQNILLLQK